MKAYAYGLLISLTLVSPGLALPTEGSHLCRPLADMKAAAVEHKVHWITLSNDQFQFARGAFILAPNTPPGMPFGDSAALLQPEGDKDGGVIAFLDGDKFCEPMPVPQEFVKMLLELGTITHEGEDF